MIRQGEVYDYQRGRVVVISSDTCNREAYPIVARIVGRTSDLEPYLIGLAERDPLSGAVNVAVMGYANPDALTKPIGLLTGATLQRVLANVHRLFDRS